jgi:UDP-N-acetylglucosamine 2-epimerase
MITVLSVVGTRPEAIKMAPVIGELRKRSDRMRSLVCSVGQHRHLLDQALNLFQIAPDYELDVMRAEQSLGTLTASLFNGLEAVVADAKPDWILAQGDTTTVFVAAMQAFYHRIPFGHVEAGLRTGHRYSPFPEEINRRIADLVSTVYFAPTASAREALLREGCPDRDIYVTGNTVIDALHDVASREYEWESGPLAQVPKDAPLVLVTAHRRESFGGPFRELCLAIRDLAHRWAKQGVYFVYPVHLNPNVRRPVAEILSDLPHVKLIEPLDYLSLVHLMKRSVLVLTDSGGIQEEAPGLHVPVLVMRETTERPEGLHTGLVQLVGTDRARIVAAADALLRSRGARPAAICASPYGDGQAARRIVSILLERSSDRRDVDAPEIPAATPQRERATAPLQ